MDKITLFFGRQGEEMKYHWLPLSYALLTAYLDLDKIEVVVIDERIEKENTIALIDKHAPDSILFGISASAGYQLRRSMETAKYVKNKFPEIPVVWGGAQVTALPQESIREDFVDVIVAGRGETILPRLINGLKEKSLNGIPGVYWKENGHIQGIPNTEYMDLDSVPSWPYHIFKVKEYLNPKTMAINLTTTYGCPNRCGFCFWYKNKSTWSAFNAQRVYKEVKYFKDNYGVKDVYFLDSDFMADIPRALEIARLLKGLDITYTTNSRVSDIALLNESDFKLLEESGCYSLQIGLESASQRMLKLMSKNIKLDDVEKIVKDIRATEIIPVFSLIFQLPTETLEDMKVTHEFVLKLKRLNSKVSIMTTMYNHLPNLPLTRLAVKHGLILPENMEGWSTDEYIKSTSYVNKPWMDEDFAREYELLFNQLFVDEGGGINLCQNMSVLRPELCGESVSYE